MYLFIVLVQYIKFILSFYLMNNATYFLHISFILAKLSYSLEEYVALFAPFQLFPLLHFHYTHTFIKGCSVLKVICYNVKNPRFVKL